MNILSWTVGVCVLLSTVFAYATTSEIETAIMDKDYRKASVLASELLKTSKDFKERTQAEYYLGLSQLRLRRYSDARSAFQIVMSSEEGGDLYDRAALGMMEALYLPGYYKDALKVGENLLLKSPKSSFLSLIYLKVARTYLKMTQWNLAKRYLDKILAEFPQSSEAPIAKDLMEEKEYFTVQVGSFLEKDRAIKLSEQLKSSGQYAYMVETTSTDGKKFYRVRVGQITALSDAQTLEGNLSQLGYPTLIYP